MLQVSRVLIFNKNKREDEQGIPLIKLWGMWLHTYGFNESNLFKVECEEGKITLTVIEPEEVPSISNETCLDGGIVNAL